MANHIRRQIRERIVTLLTGLATTGPNIFQSRVYALSPDAEMPALLVYTLSEDVTKLAFCHPGEIERTIAIAIEAIAAGPVDELDDTLDRMCKEVEVKMATDFYLQNLAKDVQLTHTEIQLQGGDSPRPVGAARMTWIAKVATTEGVPDVAV